MKKNEVYREVEMELPLSNECASNFDLEKAVCNHGFFMMSPNRWIHSTRTLKRPLRLADSTTSAMVSISQPYYPHHTSLNLQISHHPRVQITPEDRQAILDQVTRMLRISERDDKAVRDFQRLYPDAKDRNFGRLFRSPSFFEDAVKSMLLCNCWWSRSLKMARQLCDLQLIISSSSGGKKKACKSKRSLEYEMEGNFPTPRELSTIDNAFLEKHCKLGYRGENILKLANDIHLDEIETEAMISLDYNAAYKKLIRLDGFGKFSCANLLMCMGFYEEVPTDSETIRFIKEAYKKEDCGKKAIPGVIEEIYGCYSPYQCLAYWMELLQSYEKKLGKLSQLSPSLYSTVSGCSYKRKNEEKTGEKSKKKRKRKKKKKT